ncbi:hypothetical protein Hanom_Chr07g00621111 [Helianthus anomalus]
MKLEAFLGVLRPTANSVYRTLDLANGSGRVMGQNGSGSKRFGSKRPRSIAKPMSRIRNRVSMASRSSLYLG